MCSQCLVGLQLVGSIAYSHIWLPLRPLRPPSYSVQCLVGLQLVGSIAYNHEGHDIHGHRQHVWPLVKLPSLFNSCTPSLALSIMAKVKTRTCAIGSHWSWLFPFVGHSLKLDMQCCVVCSCQPQTLLLGKKKKTLQRRCTYPGYTLSEIATIIPLWIVALFNKKKLSPW